MGVNHLWKCPAQDLTLSGNDVHVWRASLEPTGTRVSSFREILAPDELEKAKRFRFCRDRERYIVARGHLRVILSCYLDMEPSDIPFFYDSHGKPFLERTSDRGWLNFNLSHSHGLALYAITRGRMIGVDLERIRTDFPCEKVAQRFFSPRENRVLGALPVEKRHEAFFTCWTRKEAFIKAKGGGLLIPLDAFDVSLAPGEPARLIACQWDPRETARWSLHDLKPGAGFVAALAVEGRSCGPAYWHTPGNVSK